MALGGSIDKSGFVSKANLIETIKREFELTFDIEAMIDGVSGDTLDYSTFCSIFEHDKEKGELEAQISKLEKTIQEKESNKVDEVI